MNNPWKTLPNWAQSLILAVGTALATYIGSNEQLTWGALLAAVVAALGNWWTTNGATIEHLLIPASAAEVHVYTTPAPATRPVTVITTPTTGDGGITVTPTNTDQKQG